MTILGILLILILAAAGVRQYVQAERREQELRRLIKKLYGGER